MHNGRSPLSSKGLLVLSPTLEFLFPVTQVSPWVTFLVYLRTFTNDFLEKGAWQVSFLKIFILKNSLFSLYFSLILWLGDCVFVYTLCSQNFKSFPHYFLFPSVAVQKSEVIPTPDPLICSVFSLWKHEDLFLCSVSLG